MTTTPDRTAPLPGSDLRRATTIRNVALAVLGAGRWGFVDPDEPIAADPERATRLLERIRALEAAAGADLSTL